MDDMTTVPRKSLNPAQSENKPSNTALSGAVRHRATRFEAIKALPFVGFIDQKVNGFCFDRS
ncbi:hypothetical protein [Pseudomonas paeninsulae]|uniref:hypothetical protein n=1 Tax=Pseudomonas paeninsulae TaxID=3110772 RepID=UPI002D769C51|nr:hypothetical protein [Pseudomonas sp. IT1137]